MADTINTTLTTAAPQTYTNKTFYDRNLLEMAKTKFVFQNHGDKKQIPLRNGKKAEFRRWVPADPNATNTLLAEGVTPDGLMLNQDKVEVELQQFGAYYKYSDIYDKVAFDEIKEACSDLLGELMGTVIEHRVRDVLAAGDNVNYAGGKTSRSALAATDVLTVDDVRKAVRDLKKAKATPFKRSGKEHYICIVSPDTEYDLMDDEKWEEANKYGNTERLYDGELGRLYGMVFITSTEAPVINNVLNTTMASYTAGTKTVVVADAISDAAKAYLTSEGAKIYVKGEEAAVASIDQATKSIVLTAVLTGTPAAGDTVISKDGAKTADPVHQSICFGDHAFCTVELSDKSGAIEFIVNGIGSAGADDPLKQRGTIGAKVGAFAAAILNEDWLLRIEHGVSA